MLIKGLIKTIINYSCKKQLINFKIEYSNYLFSPKNTKNLTYTLVDFFKRQTYYFNA
jgi:hypothetical protein